MLTIIDIKSELERGSEQTLPCGCTLTVSEQGDIDLSRRFFTSQPIFYAVIDNRLLVTPQYQQLLSCLREQGVDLQPDQQYMSAYLAFQSPFTTATLYQSIKLLRPGETCCIAQLGSFIGNDKGRQTKAARSSFFVEVNREHKLTPDELTDSLKAIIGELSPEKTVFHISSGLDSSILAILAAEVFASQAPQSPVQLATCVTRGDGCADEVTNSRRLADDIGADLKVYDFTEVDIFAMGTELMGNCLSYPIAHPSHLVEYLLDRKIIQSGATAIVNGKGPDDVLGGYQCHQDAFSDAAIHRQRVTVMDEALLCQLLTSKAPLSHLSNFWQRHEQDLTLLQRLEYDARATTEAWNIIHRDIAVNLDVKIISPFMAPQIREGLLALDDRQKVFNGRQKVFLRDTFANRYPDYIRNFAKTGMRLDLQPYFSDYNRAELFAKITVDESRAAKYFNLGQIWIMIDATLSGQRNYGWQLWSIFALMSALNQ
ncbi:MAG: asparagine synthase C-terminal domain-containing protein [Colwellia sp.]